MSKEWDNFAQFCDDFIDLTSSHMENGKLIRSFQAMTIDLASGIVDQNTKTWNFNSKQGIKRKHGGSNSGTTKRATPGKVEEILCKEEGEGDGDGRL